MEHSPSRLRQTSWLAGLAFVLAGAGGCVLAEPAAPAVRVEATADGGFACRTPAYEAVIGKTGNLQRLRAGDVDLLAPGEGAVPAAGFLNAGQFVTVDTVRAETPDTIVAQGKPKDPATAAASPCPATARITYQFKPDCIVMTLEQSLEMYGGFAWVPAASVAGSHDGLTDYTIKPGGPYQYGQTDPRWTTREGPVLRFDFGVWQRGFANANWGTTAAGGRTVHSLRNTVPAAAPVKVTLYPLARPGPQDALTFAVTTDDPDFSLPAGKPVHFAVTAANAGAAAVDAKVTFQVLDYLTRQPVGSRASELKLAAKAESLLPTDVAVDKPGPYRAAILVEEPGKPPRRVEWVFTYDFAHYAPTSTRPADFAEFWKAALAESAALPLDAKLTRVAAKCTPAIEVFKVNYATLAGRRIYGWYSRPVAPGKYPAQIRYPSSGIYPLNGPEMAADRCCLWIMIHGFDVDLSNMPAGDDPGKNYWTAGIQSPQTSMWRTIFVSLVRAVDFMVAQPQVDAQRVAVIGGSQGGGLAVVAAALDPRIGFCKPAFSGLMRLDWTVKHEPGYWPFVMSAKPAGQSEAEFLKTLAYFDPANFAPDIRCPVAAEVGLLDTVTAAGNQVAGFAAVPRGLLYLCCSPWSGHGSGSRAGNECGACYERFLKGQPVLPGAGAPVPGGK